MADPVHETELNWRQYNLYVDLYKFYLTSLIQLNTFHFAVTGGLLAYVLGRIKDVESVRFALLLPLALCCGQLCIYIFGWRSIGRLVEATKALASAQRLSHAPHFSPLRALVLLFGCLHFLTAATLGLLISRPNLFTP